MAGAGGCGTKEPTSFGPVVAGQFYPDDPAGLSSMIERYLGAAQPRPVEGKVLGFIVPHAGYIYSGPVAAYAYKQIRELRPRTVVVMAPSHYVRSEKVGVLDVDVYRTPLGEVRIAKEMIERLRRQDPDLFTTDRSLFDREHSLEVQLPFLQKTDPGVEVVPLVLGNPFRDTAAKLARALAKAFGDGVLYLASSDMSHHFPYDTAVSMDRLALEKISAMDISGLVEDNVRERSQLCGLGPVLTLMELAAALGYTHAETLKYANSGDTAGPKSSVVGYCAVVFTSAKKLDREAQEELISLARSTIEAWFRERTIPDYEPKNESLRAPGAAFVTLKEEGKLRGCIGHVVARMPLYRSVQEMAVAAAFQDPRFPPLRQEELPRVTIEISVMSPLRVVADPSEIQVGRDGLVIRKGGRSGLLLPQVAVENGWDREQFLMQTCLKAGLPTDAWKEGAEIFAFSAQVFGEEARR